ncbi:MAG: LpqB family beta-propeller domain-containing protein [Gemmatimonadota bacterium]
MRIFLPLLLCSLARGLAAQNVAEVQVTPETVTLKVGQKQALFAAAFDASGNLIPTARFTFASNNASVATAQSDGVVIGLKGGAAIVQVTSGTRSFSVAISVETGVSAATVAAVDPAPPHMSVVQAGPPASIITIEPSPIYLLPSESRHLTARGFHEDGGAADLLHVTWKSLTPETATVDADGVIVGLMAGTAIVQASIPGGIAATSPVEIMATDLTVAPTRLIMAPLDIDTLSATVPAQAGREIRNGLQWRTTSPEVLRVGPTGIVQALSAGETEVVVSGFFQERRIPVRVHPAVQTLVVTPKPSAGIIRMPLRGLKSLMVRAEAADSTPVPEAAFWWEIADSNILGFDQAKAEIAAKALGTTTITLRARGFDPITWVIEVIPGGIALDRTRFPLSIGSRLGLKASLMDDNGKAIAPADQVEWKSDRADVALVGNDGIVEATGFGHATLTATTPWGKSATADVFVVGDVVFTANRGTSALGIYQLSMHDPSNVVPLLADSFQNVQAVLSPDRTTIAVSSNRDGAFHLYLVDADGTNLRRLTTDASSDGDPAWAPDGKRIIYTSARAGSTQIYSVLIDGTGNTQLTSSGGGNQSPVVSPDGRSIAFVSGRDGNDEVYRMDINGADQVNISATREKEASPRYFPNGDLAFAQEVKRKGWQIVRVPADASPSSIIATGLNPITSFAVSRDGDRLAIVAGRVTDPRHGKAEFAFSIQALTGGAPWQIPLMLNEQVVRPEF